MEQELVIIYSIKQFTGGISFFYPEAHLASVEKGIPQYLKKAGSYEVIDSYNISYKGQDHEKLLKICADLNPLEIENSFQKKKGKHQSLSQLFETDVVKTTISKKIEHGLNRFLELIQTNKYFLYNNPQRKVHLENNLIKFSPIDLSPLLKFEKTATGTNYFLYLKFQDQLSLPIHLDLQIVTNFPCYVMQENTFFYVKDIEGKKIQPMLSKECIFIPERITHDYFNKFIKDIIAKVEVEVSGFEYEVINEDPKPYLRFSTAFADDHYEAIPLFEYNGLKFMYGDKQAYKVNIDISENNEIKVVQRNRDFIKEDELLKIFEELGFEKTAAFRFRYNQEDPYQAVFKIHQNKDLFEKLDYRIEFPEVNNKPLALDVPTIIESVTTGNDWFDVYAVVKIGNIEVEFSRLVQHIKKGNRTYQLKDGAVFIIPLEWMTKYEMLSRFGEEVDGKIRISKSHHTIVEGLDLQMKKGKKPAIVTEDDFELHLPSTLHANLRSYQTEGVKWLVKHYKNGMGACLADDMGLGKTLQTLALLTYVKEDLGAEIIAADKPMQLSLFDTYASQRKALQALIVVPASLVFNWEREIKKFAPSLMVKNHTGPDRSKNYIDLIHFDIILTSYPIAGKDHQLLEKIFFEYIVIDESHYIKNRDSKIFKALNTLNAKNKISLSGTPIENSLADLWSQMQFINPDILLTYPQFKKMYQDPIEKLKDEKAIQELKQLLNPFILRRSKKDVLKDIPDAEEQVYYCAMDEAQSKLLESEKSKARNSLLGAHDQPNFKLHVFNALMRLRQLANHPKLVDNDSKVESCKYIEVSNTIDTLVKSDNKLLIFSSFLGHLDIYKDYLNTNKIGFSILTGDMDAKKRKKAVDDFENKDEIKVMLLSIKAGNTGLNLTAANYVLLLDPWWNPFVEEQAKARAHRIGQKRKVTFIKFITKGSIEEKILTLQEKKLKLAEEFIDENVVMDFDEDTLKFLLT